MVDRDPADWDSARSRGVGHRYFTDLSDVPDRRGSPALHRVSTGLDSAVTETPRKDRRFPLGLLIGAVLLQAASTPGQTIGLSVLVDPMIERLDTSRSAFALSYMIGTLLGAATLSTTGRLLDRVGVRRAALGIGVLFSLTIASLAGVSGLIGLTVAFVGTRALGQGALTLTASTAVVIGFNRRRGFAIGLKSALGSALMALMPLGIVVLLDRNGLTATWILLALGAGVVVLGVAASPVLDQRDADVNRLVTGTIEGDAAWSRAEATRTTAFAVVTSAVALSALVGTGLAFHHIDLLGTRGLSATVAAANFLPQTLAAVAGAVVAGRFVDRVRPQPLLAACMMGLVVASLLPLVLGPGVLVVVYGLVLGSSSAAVRSVEASTLARWFGLAHIGEIRGVVMTAVVAASAAGPLLFALSAEHLGGYGPALVVSAVTAAIMAVLSWVVTPPAAAPPLPRPL